MDAFSTNAEQEACSNFGGTVDFYLTVPQTSDGVSPEDLAVHWWQDQTDSAIAHGGEKRIFSSDLCLAFAALFSRRGCQ